MILVILSRDIIDIEDGRDDDAGDREVIAKYFGSSQDCMMLNHPIDKCLTISPPLVIMQCIIHIYTGPSDDNSLRKS